MCLTRKEQQQNAGQLSAPTLNALDRTVATSSNAELSGVSQQERQNTAPSADKKFLLQETNTQTKTKINKQLRS